MNLTALRSFCAIVDHGLHVSNAADALHRSQPALSRQIQQLEAELGVTLFARRRNRLVRLTREGEAILDQARGLLARARDLERTAGDLAHHGRGTLTLATTHTQARYTLPRIVQRFMAAHPGVSLSLWQGTPPQCAEMVARGAADLAICTQAAHPPEDVVQIPCYDLNRVVVTPPRHPLLRVRPITLAAMASYPIISYAEGFSGRSIVDRAFRDAGLAPKIVLSAIDADVSKAYVELGLGIAILAGIAFDPSRDRGLRAVDARHLFAASRLNIVLRRHAHVPGHQAALLRMFAPHLRTAELRRLVRDAAHGTRERAGVPDI